MNPLHKKWAVYGLSLLLVASVSMQVFAGGQGEAEVRDTKAYERPADFTLVDEDVMVYETLEGLVGEYGGFFIQAITDDTTQVFNARRSVKEGLFKFPVPDAQRGDIVPNVAKGYDLSADMRVLTVYLRRGMQWSDGHPFTADDVLFMWNDVLMDDDVPMSAHASFYAGARGQQPTVAKIDDYTVEFRYSQPQPLALERLSPMYEAAWPKHILAQYHPKFNSNATWEQWEEASRYQGQMGRVTLGAFYYDGWTAGQEVRMTRNPYYWKVDQAGNQLPYLDGQRLRVISDREQLALRLAEGALSADGNHVSVHHLAVMQAAVNDPNRHLELRYAVDNAGPALWFNYDHPNPALRSLFRDVNFRKGMSLGFDRAEISEVLYYDFLIPSSYGLSASLPFMTEEILGLYTEYNPQQAARYFDAAGLRDINGDGFRQLPNGENLHLIITYLGSVTLYRDTLEMMSETLAELGIRMSLQALDQGRIAEVRFGGQFDIFVYDMDGHEAPLLDPIIWAPVGTQAPFWHSKYHTDGPFSSWYQEMVRLFNQASGTADLDARNALLERINRLAAENVMHLYVGRFDRPWGMDSRLGNMMPFVRRMSLFGGWGGQAELFQVYWKDDQARAASMR